MLERFKIFLVLLPTVFYAQHKPQILWNDDFSFLYYLNNTIELRNLNNEIIRSYNFDSDLNFSPEYKADMAGDHFTYVDKEGLLNIASISGGMYYKSSGETIYRIDNSFDHKMTNHADVFVRNDTVFKFGGYGYWSNRNMFTYFDQETLEWEFYPISPPVVPPSMYRFCSSFTDDNYYVYGGLLIDPFTGFSSINNSNIWVFNFPSRSWDNLGVSNIPRFNSEDFISLRPDKKLILNSKTQKKYVISFKENQVNTVEFTKHNFELTGEKVFFIGDSVFNINHNDKLIYSDLKSALDYTNPVKKSPIYVNTSVLYSGLQRAAVLAISLLVLLILYLKYKRNQRPRVSDFGIRYKGISYSFKEKEKKILLLVLSKKEVFSQEMYNEIEDVDLSYPQNNKIKNDTIKKINAKVEKILGMDDFIKSKKLETDARVLIYYTDYAHLFVTPK